ncbi:hypothetical protein Syun_020367 [Stephania yunnanensis]|uniref:Protein SDA1 n=1 Tax=Stephania yunnanensis TaxID=152371 RepID=A0AAP0IE20_9MAGN
MASPWNRPHEFDLPDLAPDSLTASGRYSEKLSLPSLQSKMKCDPEGYDTELSLLYRHFDSSLHLFHQQAALNINNNASSTALAGCGGGGGDTTVAKELGDLALFLAQVAPFYPTHLADFPNKLAGLLGSAARSLPSFLRVHLAQALILLTNRKIVDIGENLALFMELQTLGDRVLKKIAFSHVVHSIRRMNQKHKNDPRNKALQKILFSMLKGEDELKAKRSLVVLCDLHRRRVWFDEKTANAICAACLHSSSRIMISALSFLLGYEKIGEADDSDDSGSEDDKISQNPQVVISKEAIYKAHHKGTLASKKKKQAKLQRAMRSMKKQQRHSSENNNPSYYSPLNHLIGAQAFVEELFGVLQKRNERFEVKMMMLKVIARTIGLHRLVLLNFYSFLQRYVQPHQRDVTELLAAAVQACHDMVPPDVVEPLFRQLVNQFVHDRSRTEAIAVGLNTVREICLRMPLLMTEDLLQDLVLYKKSHEKSVSTAARSLMMLFREVCPSMLVKKDRGRPTDPKARPKLFGEVDVVTNVPGAELLENDDDGSISSVSDGQNEILAMGIDSVVEEDDGEMEESDEEVDGEGTDQSDDDEEVDAEGIDQSDDDDDEDQSDDNEKEEESESDESDMNSEEEQKGIGEEFNGDCDSNDDEETSKVEDKEEPRMQKKRKTLDYEGLLNAADTSLRALKKLAGEKMESKSTGLIDGILSNEDFQLIKELKAKKEAKLALAKHGLLGKNTDGRSTAFKIPSSEKLSIKRVDPSKLEANIRRKLSKEERLALVRAGREDRGKYQARAAVKQKKTGGLSNRQKEHKKAMPLAAKRAKVARSRQEKKKLQSRSSKQFRGKKAWK